MPTHLTVRVVFDDCTLETIEALLAEIGSVVELPISRRTVSDYPEYPGTWLAELRFVNENEVDPNESVIRLCRSLMSEGWLVERGTEEASAVWNRVDGETVLLSPLVNSASVEAHLKDELDEAPAVEEPTPDPPVAGSGVTDEDLALIVELHESLGDDTN